jgi:MYXO-CTERM domain-containing protein
MNRCAFGLITLSVALAAAGSAGAQVWAETGPVFGGHPDADRLPAVANVTQGIGPLSQITGWCLNGGDADLYRITVTDAPNFAATVSTTLAGRNLSLALFNAAGFGVAANYDSTPSNTDPVLSNIPGLTNGTYYLLIYGTVNYPTDFATTFIFTPPAASSGITGLILPDANAFALSGYLTDFGAGFGGSFAASPYTANLTGAGFAETPTPGAAALLGVAGLGLMRRRR